MSPPCFDVAAPLFTCTTAVVVSSEAIAVPPEVRLIETSPVDATAGVVVPEFVLMEPSPVDATTGVVVVPGVVLMDVSRSIAALIVEESIDSSEMVVSE